MESKFTKAIIFLAIVLLSAEYLNIAYENRESQYELKPIFTAFRPQDFVVPIPKDFKKPKIESYKSEHYIPVLVTYKKMELTSLGNYYLTAYCPWECGYNGSNYPAGWRTASGAICHRADYEHRLSEPTTCAIDRNLHRFGTEFYIPYFDRVFTAEDTGSAVKGKHLDLFYEEYGEMASFPTGSYEVFAVDWVEVTVAVTEDEYEYFLEHGTLE